MVILFVEGQEYPKFAWGETRNDLMNPIQDTLLTSQLLTLIKPMGKDVPIRLGEIIEAQVVDLFPSGGLTLKVKDGYFPARTDLVLAQNDTIFLKVLGFGGSGKELTLQLLSTKTGSKEIETEAKPSVTVDQEKIENLIKEAANLISKLKGQGAEEVYNLESILPKRSLEIGRLNVVLKDLFEAIPANSQLLSKEVRTQIQQVLQASLKGLGQDVQERMIQLLKQLPEEMNGLLLAQNLKDEWLVSMEGLLGGQLKTALENSGVVLEAKLRALVESNADGKPMAFSDISKIQKDFKAVLLQLKEVFQQTKDQDLPAGFFQRLLTGVEKGRGEETRPFQKILGGVDTLLKDVETFQLLSKLSDSFCTFLPIQWEALKRGELVFKRRRQESGGASYSCGIHLDLEKLGPVSAFIFMHLRTFFVTFKVEHSELKAMIQSHFAELQENFSRQGMNLKNISLLGRADPVVDPFERIESEETIINIRI